MAVVAEKTVAVAKPAKMTKPLAKMPILVRRRMIAPVKMIARAKVDAKPLRINALEKMSAKAKVVARHP